MKQDDSNSQPVKDSETFGVVAIMKMGDIKVKYHLQPLALTNHVSSLHVVRPSPLDPSIIIDNSTYHEISGRSLFLKLWRVYQTSLTLSKNKSVKALVSFYAMPYGVIALIIGKLLGKPVHIGFVGSDWYKIGCSWYGRLLNTFFRKADFITVTGNKMKTEMQKRGYPPDKISLLPHSVDTNKGMDIPPEKRPYDGIFVGYLNPVKRVDLIVNAVKLVKMKYPGINICIVGDGPLRSKLEARVREFQLTQNIKFVGHQKETSRWFSAARMVIVASDREGFPFSIVEGMTAGAVPVSTAVGTIPDYIRNGYNGVLFPAGDESMLADAILKLAQDKAYYQKLRQVVLSQRSEFSYQKATQVWEKWFSSISEKD